MALYRQIAGTQLGFSRDLQSNDLIISSDLLDYTPFSTVPKTPATIETGTYVPPPTRDTTIDLQNVFDYTPIDTKRPDDTTPITDLINLTPISTTPTGTTKPNITPQVLPPNTQTAITNNLLPLAAIAALAVIAIKGDDLLKGKRKIALLGGLGLLYYGMAKNKIV